MFVYLDQVEISASTIILYILKYKEKIITTTHNATNIKVISTEQLLLLCLRPCPWSRKNLTTPSRFFFIGKYPKSVVAFSILK